MLQTYWFTLNSKLPSSVYSDDFCLSSLSKHYFRTCKMLLWIIIFFNEFLLFTLFTLCYTAKGVSIFTAATFFIIMTQSEFHVIPLFMSKPEFPISWNDDLFLPSNHKMYKWNNTNNRFGEEFDFVTEMIVRILVKPLLQMSKFISTRTLEQCNYIVLWKTLTWLIQVLQEC